MDIDVSEALRLAQAHAWIALAALVVGALVRLLKSDVPLTPTLPPRWRPWLALGAGIVAGVLEKVVAGTDWKTAILGGVAAGVVAIMGHVLGIESLRGGRELPVPGVKKDGAP